MGATNVSGYTAISLLENGDSINTVLLSTSPLYQTFKKGTNDFSPNWETMQDTDRPKIYGRSYSTMEGEVLTINDAAWKYNGVAMAFDSGGICTYPDICSGKIQEIDYNGSKALKMIGNVASETNNDSDMITIMGNVEASGQTLQVTADIPLLIEEGANNLYRLFLNTTDDVLDGDDESLAMTAILYNNGALVTGNVQYEFTNLEGDVLRAKNSSDTLTVTPSMIDSQLIVVCKAYVNNSVVATAQRQVWDSKDPISLHCDQGLEVSQRLSETRTYSYFCLNNRTGVQISQSSVDYDLKVIRNSDRADISNEFSIGDYSVIIPGAKIREHQKRITIVANATVAI